MAKYSNNEYAKLDEMAISLRMDYGCYEYKLDVFQLVQKMCITLVPYSKISEEKRNYLFEHNVNDGFTAIGHGVWECIIYYNDEMPLPRQHFTIAHEIKHVLYCEKDPSQKDEELANHFARALLASSCLLFDYIDNQNAAEVADRFGISNPAAKNALTALNSRVGAMGTQLKQYEIEYLNYINSYNLLN